MRIVLFYQLVWKFCEGCGKLLLLEIDILKGMLSGEKEVIRPCFVAKDSSLGLHTTLNALINLCGNDCCSTEKWSCENYSGI